MENGEKKPAQISEKKPAQIGVKKPVENEEKKSEKKKGRILILQKSISLTLTLPGLFLAVANLGVDSTPLEEERAAHAWPMKLCKH